MTAAATPLSLLDAAVSGAVERPTRVVVVDDSAVARRLIRAILTSDAGIQIVGSASDPATAWDIIATQNPDVVTLDVEMPGMNGLTFLERLMRLRPTPVIMVSSLTEEGAEVALRALEMGAVDFIPKSSLRADSASGRRSEELIAKVRTAATARVRPALVVNPVPPKPTSRVTEPVGGRVIALGASTGGVEALREILCALPADCPPVLVAQHMPPRFTARFAERLNGVAAAHVVEAQEGQLIVPGTVYIAPGDRQLRLGRWDRNYICRVTDDPPVNGHRPSVDVLFRSIAMAVGTQAAGAILTGMGNDGAKGLKEMRVAGARTLGQDMASCVVYGMPKAAAAIGATEEELPLEWIADRLLELCGRNRAASVASTCK